MVRAKDRQLAVPALPLATSPSAWRGRSGRTYWLSPLSIEEFCFDGGLYVLARGGLVLWVGSSAEVIEDAESRARVRLALSCADRVFHLPAASEGVERMTHSVGPRARQSHPRRGEPRA